MWKQCPELRDVYTVERFDSLLSDEKRLQKVYQYVKRESKNNGYDTTISRRWADFSYEELLTVLRQERDDLAERELMKSIGFEYRFTRHYSLSLERGTIHVQHLFNGEIDIVLRKEKQRLAARHYEKTTLVESVVSFLREFLIIDDYGYLDERLKDLLAKGVDNGAE